MQSPVKTPHCHLHHLRTNSNHEPSIFFPPGGTPYFASKSKNDFPESGSQKARPLYLTSNCALATQSFFFCVQGGSFFENNPLNKRYPHSTRSGYRGSKWQLPYAYQKCQGLLLCGYDCGIRCQCNQSGGQIKHLGRGSQYNCQCNEDAVSWSQGSF